MNFFKSRPFYVTICLLLAIFLFYLAWPLHPGNDSALSNPYADGDHIMTEQSDTLYGICVDSLQVETNVIASGESFSVLLSKHDIAAAVLPSIQSQAKDIFDLRSIKAGNSYTLLSTSDSTSIPTYLVYDVSKKKSVIFQLVPPYQVTTFEREVQVRRKVASATIESSLWNAMIKNKLSPSLAMKLSDIFQWSVDFYAIQQGDAFKVIYDELYIDSTLIGTGTIYGAWFANDGQKHYAIRYTYADKGKEVSNYWDENGKSLKSMFLKAPLKFSRISSRFTNSRLHPIFRIRRPHHGVDYAAPIGTPVRAIADGTVIHRAYSGGAGNYVKLRHSNHYQSGYMHLSRYAKGLRVGKRVSQGDIIAYVGSTGSSTGPHLDFRIWLKGKAINPLKIGRTKGPDITSCQKAAYQVVCDSILKELNAQ